MSELINLTLNDIPFAALSIDDNAKIIASNTLFMDISGYSCLELKGMNATELLPDLLSFLTINSSEHDKEEQEAEQSQIIVSDTLALTHASQLILNVDIKFNPGLSPRILYFELNETLTSEEESIDIVDTFDTASLASEENSTTSHTDISEALSLDAHSDIQLNGNNTLCQQGNIVLSTMLKPFWECDLQTSNVYYSPMVMEILGYEEKPYNGPISFFEHHFSPEMLKKLYYRFNRFISGESSELAIEYPLTRQDGNEIWVKICAQIERSEQGSPARIFGTLEDITEHILSIQELKKQNSYLALAERISHSGQWRIDFVESDIYWSLGVYSIYGINPLNVMPVVNQQNQVVLTGKASDHLSCFDQVFIENTSFHYKATIYRQTGQALKVEIIGDIERDEHDQIIGAFGVIRDITKSEQTIEKLNLLAMVNYTINVPIFFINEEDDIVYQDLTSQLSEKFSGLFGYLNLSIEEYRSLKIRAKASGQIKESNISFDEYESVYDLSVTFEPDEGIYIWIVDNITQKFKEEQQQAISNRLALLGNTFGSVSHDINNVLGVALGSIEMLELKIAKGDSNIGQYLERVKNAIDKGKNVTERLLAFTRKTKVKEVEFDPNKDIDDNKYIFQQLLSSTIKFTLNLSQTQCIIRFPQGEFVNIVLNLVLNAQDAIHETGKSGHIDVSTEIKDGRFLVHVNDDGVGIKPEDITKIFDPFYTSKTASKGNGIGLANVYNTMYKHHGDVKVAGHGELGGAHFTLCFDTVKIQEVAPEKNVDNERYVKQSVLVLDDETSIAEFVAAIFEQRGANVKYACTKSELINIIDSLEHCDVFITDMFMPEISGREAVEMVLNKFANVKILSMSGYIDKEEGNWTYPLLRKPFNSKELCEFIDS